MKTQNDFPIFVHSMNKKFLVRFMTFNVDEANQFMKDNPDTSCIDETEDGIVIIANNKETK